MPDSPSIRIVAREGRDEFHLVEHGLEFRRGADDDIEIEFFVESLVQLLHLDLERPGLERTLDEDFKALDVDGLCEKIDGAALHRLDGRIDVAVGGHHEDGWALRERQGLVDHLEAGFAGHPQVGENDIEGLRVEQVERLVSARGDRDVVIFRKRLLKSLAGVFLVVDDEDAGHHARHSHGRAGGGQARPTANPSAVNAAERLRHQSSRRQAQFD